MHVTIDVTGITAGAHAEHTVSISLVNSCYAAPPPGQSNAMNSVSISASPVGPPSPSVVDASDATIIVRRCYSGDAIALGTFTPHSRAAPRASYASDAIDSA
jgi:hypothetical protein